MCAWPVTVLLGLHEDTVGFSSMPKALFLGGLEASSSLNRRLQRRGPYWHHASLSLGSCEQGHDELLAISFYLKYHEDARGLCYHQISGLYIHDEPQICSQNIKADAISLIQHLLFPFLALIINLYSRLPLQN